MKNLAMIISSLIAASLFTGCVEYVEVPRKLPIYPKPACKEVNKVKLGDTIILGIDHGIDYKDIPFDKYSFIFVPKPMKQLNYDVLFVYTKEGAIELIRCRREHEALLDKSNAFNQTNNEEIP